MKNREVDTIASNSEHLRMRIFDGDIPADKYHEELLRLERGQWETERRSLLARIARLEERT